MTQLILSSANILKGSSSVVRNDHPLERTNAEIIRALRLNFIAAQRRSSKYHSPTSSRPISEPSSSSSSINSGTVTPSSRPPFSRWTERVQDRLYVPRVNWNRAGLEEPRSQYEITAKLFFLPGFEQFDYASLVDDATDLVFRQLKTETIDQLILSVPGISLHHSDYPAETIGGKGLCAVKEERTGVGTIVQLWILLEKLKQSGAVDKLGVSEFDKHTLEELVKDAEIKPAVDQISVENLNMIPYDITSYARQEKIELLTHNDCTDPIPKGTMRALLGQGLGGCSVCVTQTEDDPTGECLRGDIKPQFAVKYTAVVKDRGVVENKGYFVAAYLDPPSGAHTKSKVSLKNIRHQS